MKKWLVISLIVLMLCTVAGCGSKEAAEPVQPAAPENEQVALAVGTTPGPVSYALAYLAENPADDMTLEIKPWQKGDQLLAMITSNEVNMSATPITNAFMLYNKGIDIQLVNVSVWGMLYVLSPEDSVQSVADLKGQQVAVAGQGGLHDLVFRHLLIQNGVDPDKDLEILYLDLPEASAKLATGELKYAVLNEPNSSMATLNARKGGVELKRVLDLQEEWQKVTGQEKARIPQAGFVVLNGEQVGKNAVVRFQEKFTAAAEWVNNNPAEAAPIVEKHFEWMKAPAVEQSLQFARLNPQWAAECQEEIEAFFTELSKTAPPEALGGKLPDAEFYFQP